MQTAYATPNTAPPTTSGTGVEPVDPADLARKHRWFRAYETNKRREMDEQRQARQYYHDKQWTDEEVRRLNGRGQQATVRNRIKRKIDFLKGVEQRLRRDPKAFPRTPKHEHDADTATAVLRYICDVNRWEKGSSASMHDGLVSGIGVMFVGIERGDPKLKHVHADRFFYDPRSIEHDFSDAQYMGLHLWMDVDDAAARWPAHKNRLMAMIDGQNVSVSLSQDADKEQQWGDFENRRVRIVEFWERKPVAAFENGYAWYYCYFTGEHTLESGWSPYKGENGEPDCPYEAWSPYVDEKGDRYGMIRTMKSVQDEINYSASKILHRIATDRLFYEDGAIDDIDEASRQLARPDGKLKITRGEWGKTVGIIDQTRKIDGETERFQLAVTEIENLGPNPGLVGQGQGVDGASGRALLAQRDSGMTELSPIFEQHRDWKLRVYRKAWLRARQAWPGEKWIRVTDDDKSTQFIGLNQIEMDPMTGQISAENMIAQVDVDIMLNEGPDTITMNEELLQTLAQVGEAATGPLGRVLIELSNAPNKERLLKMLEQANAPSPEVQAMQQRMAKLEEMLAAANIDKTVAEVENRRADTLGKLITAATPQQQQTDEFGNPVGAPPAQPDMMAAMAAMSMFPLQYGGPTLEQQAEMMTAQPLMPPDGMGAPPEMMPPAGPQGPMPMPSDGQGMPPDQMMPEQLTDAGALPIDPMV